GRGDRPVAAAARRLRRRPGRAAPPLAARRAGRLRRAVTVPDSPRSGPVSAGPASTGPGGAAEGGSAPAVRPGGLVAQVGVERGSFALRAALTVPAGEVVCVLGPNGAGKTTLLRALAGLLPLTGGRLVLDGQVLDDPAAGAFLPAHRRPVGVVFQDYLLFPHLSARDNIAFGLRAR